MPIVDHGSIYPSNFLSNKRFDMAAKRLSSTENPKTNTLRLNPSDVKFGGSTNLKDISSTSSIKVNIDGQPQIWTYCTGVELTTVEGKEVGKPFIYLQISKDGGKTFEPVGPIKLVVDQKNESNFIENTARGIRNPEIIQIDPNTLRIYYSAIDEQGTMRIYSATTSTDFKDEFGINFKDEGCRLETGIGVNQGPDTCSVIKDIAGTGYRMAFVSDISGKNSISFVTSDSNGIKWGPSNEIQFPQNCMDPELFVHNRCTFMFYMTPQEGITSYTGAEPTRLKLAVNVPGKGWQEIWEYNPGIGKAVGDPDVIKNTDGTYTLFYYEAICKHDPDIEKNDPIKRPTNYNAVDGFTINTINFNLNRFRL